MHYSRMRKAEIIEIIRNSQQSWAPDIRQRSVGSPQSGGPKAPVTPLRNRTTPLGGAQVSWVRRIPVPSDPRPVYSVGLLAPLQPMQPNQTQSIRLRPNHPRQPRQSPQSGAPRASTQQEMDIFE